MVSLILFKNLISRIYILDTYKIVKKELNSTSNIIIDENDIAWEVDKEHNFKNLNVSEIKEYQ
jgi:hypothetical protein